MSDTWTIGELAEHAARALRAGAPAPVNGRVRDVPGARLIRWYMTIGLVDPPLTRRGRIAQYGRRHLLQLVAIKRLQAAGHSIAQIQAALTGATNRMLEAAALLTDAPLPGGSSAGTFLADGPPTGSPRADDPPTGSFEGSSPATSGDLPVGPLAGGPLAGDPAANDAEAADAQGNGLLAALAADAPGLDGVAEGAAARGRFWAERPSGGGGGEAARPVAGPGAETHAGSVGGSGAKPSGGPDAEPVGGSRAGVIAGVRLGKGVRLVLDTGRTPSAEDVQAVLAAAGPLLAVLKERKLT
jgi:DNA-binding transcriptional MerR regulator